MLPYLAGAIYYCPALVVECGYSTRHAGLRADTEISRQNCRLQIGRKVDFPEVAESDAVARAWNKLTAHAILIGNACESIVQRILARGDGDGIELSEIAGTDGNSHTGTAVLHDKIVIQSLGLGL